MSLFCRTSPVWPCSVAILFLLFSPLCSEGAETKWARERIVFAARHVTILAERADSPEKRAQGLMRRTSLGKNEGMIFYFDETGYHTFWMYNTLIPLTVIFVDENLRVVDMKDMVPCAEKNGDLCPVYAPRAPARYAIEVNRGFTVKHGISIGDRVSIKKANERG